jgi:hypothetical protein
MSGFGNINLQTGWDATNNLAFHPCREHRVMYQAPLAESDRRFSFHTEVQMKTGTAVSPMPHNASSGIHRSFSCCVLF